MVEFSGFFMVYSLTSKERNNDKKTHFQWFRIFLFELWGEIHFFLNVNITTCHRGLKSGHINWVKKNHYAMELEFLKITFLNLNMYYLKKNNFLIYLSVFGNHFHAILTQILSFSTWNYGSNRKDTTPRSLCASETI